MKRFAAVLLSATLLASPAMAQQEVLAIRSITVSGMSERKVVPDEAHINVNLNAQHKDMATAKSAHNTKLTKLMDIVKKAGIDEKKVRTQSSNVQPVYTYQPPNKRTFEGYRVQTNLDITVGDTSKLGGLMDSITSAGFEQGANTEWGDLMSVYYTLSNPDAIRDEMLMAAIANAKAKAGRMASAAGAELGNVYQINEQGTSQFRPVMVMAARSEMAPPAMPMAKDSYAPPAGEQEVQANVTVTYELK